MVKIQPFCLVNSDWARAKKGLQQTKGESRGKDQIVGFESDVVIRS